MLVTKEIPREQSSTTVMPKRPDFILKISVRNIEDFSPDAVVKSPRTFRPVDVQNACLNVSIEASPGTPAPILALARYAAIDFFAQAHGTGLYNRQQKLWEALARVVSIEVYQLRKGIFSSEKIPEFDFSFMDYRQRVVALMHFASPANTGAPHDYLKSTNAFIQRASQVQGITGVFLSFHSPFPPKVLEFIRRDTNAIASTTARFESIMPKLDVPINLLEIDRSPVFDPSTQAEFHKIRLIHPDLSKKKLGSSPAPNMAADMNLLDSPASGRGQSGAIEEP